jgi:hypothetical protein
MLDLLDKISRYLRSQRRYDHRTVPEMTGIGYSYAKNFSEQYFATLADGSWLNPIFA